MPNNPFVTGRRALLCSLMLLLPLGSAWGQRLERGRAVRMLERPHVAAQFIVKFRDAEQAPENAAVGAYASGGVRQMSRLGTSKLHLVRTGRGGAEVLEQLSQHPDVEYVEPDYILTASKLPNDPLFGNLWGLLNAARPGADIGATLAWDITTGSKGVMVGVIDTGVDFTHPDLSANVWSAPREFTVALGTGTVTCAAGTRGFNAITKTCMPMDDNGHGTHVAGTIAGAGNNGSGVTGISWTGMVLPLKFLAADGSGSTSNAILAINFAVQLKAQFPTEANIRVLNNSWGGGGNSQALETAIGQANTAEMLFVAAAGNEASNNDTTGSFPANSAQVNVISVASTDQLDGLSSFSNYGLKVHLAAPGSKILSTFLNGQYATMSGTSMATPHVAGAAALVLSACGSLDTAGLKRVLLQTVDPLNVLTGKTATGGRLNVFKAVRQCATPGVTLQASPSSRVLKAGETTTFTLTPGSFGGVTGTPTLQVTGLPTGGTATVIGEMVFGTGSTVSVATAGTVTPGTYALTATLAMGSLRATTSLTLVVQAATVTAPFTLAATPGAIDVVQGTSSALTVTIARTSGFTGPVTVVVEGLSAGLTVAPVTIASGATTGTVTLAAAATATLGTANVRVVGTGGSPAGSVTAPVTVTVRVPVAPFTMTVPGALEIAPGGNATAVVTIVRSAGFTGPVTVTAAGLSAGLTVAPVTIASGATTGNVVFVATAGATLSTANVRVVGTGGSPAGSVTAPMSVTVRVPVAPFTMTVPGTLQIAPGGNATAVVTIVRSAGFTGPVTVTTAGLSAGLTVAPVTIASGATTGNVVFVATAGATLRTANVRVVGTGGSPAGSVTAPVTVIVRVPFTMTVPGALQIAPGGNVTTVVTIVRAAGFTGPVTVTAAGLSAGLTVAPVTIASGATTGNVVFVATAAATGGTAAVRLVGTGEAPATSTAAVNVTVRQTLTLTIDAARTEIKAGTVGSIPVRLTSNGGISGRIEFSVGGLPAGARLGWVAGAAPNSYVLNVTVASSAAAGTSTLQIGAKVGAMVASGQTTTLVIVK